MRIVLAAMLVVGCDDAKPVKRNAAPVTPSAADVPLAAPAGPPLEVTGGQLFNDYANDVSAADAKYLHRHLRVHCIVGKGHGSRTLDIEAANGTSHVEAWFPEGSEKVLRSLKHYDEVFLLCIGGGMADVPWLTDCSLDRVVETVPR